MAPTVHVLNSSACRVYVMWVELGHCHFLYVPAVSNVVTTGNGTSTNNVLKWNRVLGFEFRIQSRGGVDGQATWARARPALPLLSQLKEGV